MIRRTAFAPFVLLAVSCSSGASSTGTPPVLTLGAEGQALSYLTNLIPTPLDVGSEAGFAIVDTGNPFVLLDPGTFPNEASLAQNGGTIASLAIGSQTLRDVFAISSNAGLTNVDPTLTLAANVGCTAICSYIATFNYRDVAFGLATTLPPPPSGLLEETIFPFAFEGAGTVDGVAIPTSRIVVKVTIEQNDFMMILDSGASLVTVSASAFAKITSDGRAQISGGEAETTAGFSSIQLARASSVVVGGVLANSVVVANDPSFQANLDEISNEVGSTIDGSLGGTFLHDFYVTVDYPNQRVHLARYADQSFTVDPAQHLGLTIAESDGGYVVETVSGDAAAKGLTSGTYVESIDGVALAGLGPAQALLLLYGQPGTTKSVVFGSQTADVLVEDALPLAK